ncbi:MAG TPA: serine protease [Saprospiraceae bacterium]|nr:serine protease [Saprospiraceae bacterium]
MNIEDYTIEELLYVLRHRTSKGDKVLKTSSVTNSMFNMEDPRFSKLDEVSTAEIIIELRKKEKAIYGPDRRYEIIEIQQYEIIENSKAVVAIIENNRLTDNGNNTTTLHGKSFKDEENLCDCEKYLNQPVVSHGTGFLVDPSIIVTAAHCIDENNISKYKFVFGFDTLKDGSTRTIIENKNIVSASRILGRRIEDSTGIDWAVIQLESPILEIEPLICDFNDTITTADRVYCIGHPSGLPKKVSTDGIIKDVESYFFTANIDTYAGNSGSPVFHNQSHQVVGILVRGEEDDFIKVGDCYQSQRCLYNNCAGEDVMKTPDFKHLIPDQNLPGFEFDPSAIEVIDGRYIQLKQGELLDFYGKENKIDKAIQTIQYYGFNFKGYLNGNLEDMHYYLTDGMPPGGPLPSGQDEIKFNRNKIEVRRIGSRWKIVDENMSMLDFDQNQENARQALSIILRYRFNFQSYVGRPNPPLKYFRQ